VALLVVALAIAAWFVPPLLRIALQDDTPSSAAQAMPGSGVELDWTQLWVPTLGGVTVDGVEPPGAGLVGAPGLLGAWVFSGADAQRFEQAMDAWALSCFDAQGDVVSPTPQCRPTGADDVVAQLASQGARLDASTALPQHIAGRQQAILVTMWRSQRCESAAPARLVVHASNWLAKADVGLLTGLAPGCNGR